MVDRILAAKRRDPEADAGLRSEAAVLQVSALACRAEASGVARVPPNRVDPTVEESKISFPGPVNLSP